VTTQIGNHFKMAVPLRLRGETRAFYREALGCRPLASERAELDLYEFAGGFVLGLLFVPDGDALPPQLYRQATWLELKTEDPNALRQRILACGGHEIKADDDARFCCQAPGGQVFRIAPLAGGA